MKQKPIPPALTPFLEGKVLLIDKPLNWTSFDMVKKVRWLTKIMKVGHAGTLDPLATGLLIICTGKYTKQINDYIGDIGGIDIASMQVNYGNIPPAKAHASMRLFSKEVMPNVIV